jgi:predicted nuclease with TOPRIM domain
MSEREEFITKELEKAVVATDVCASIENLGKVIGEYKPEVKEEDVVWCVLSSVFKKYSASREAAKSNRQKLENERAQHAEATKKLQADNDNLKCAVKNLGGDKSVLQVSVKSLTRELAKVEKQRREMAEKVKKLKDEIHFMKPFTTATFDENGGAWFSTAGPRTSTQINKPVPKKTKFVVPETCQMTEGDADDEESQYPY